MINLHEKRMHVKETAENGVVNEETIFEFYQKEDRVLATYRGGKVSRGVLVGILSEDRFSFNYGQQHLDGNIAGGHSICDIEIQSDGKYRLIEHFQWERGTGRNVFVELG